MTVMCEIPEAFCLTSRREYPGLDENEKYCYDSCDGQKLKIFYEKLERYIHPTLLFKQKLQIHRPFYGAKAFPRARRTISSLYERVGSTL